MKTLKVLLQEVVSGIKAWVNSNFAQESNTVHKTGNETVNGVKTWNSVNIHVTGQIKLKSTSQEIGVIPNSDNVQYLEFTDKNDAQHGVLGLWDNADGSSVIQIYISDKFKNGAKDSTGTLERASISFGFKPSGSKTFTFSGQISNHVIPYTNNTYNLGDPSYQWDNVYAKNYYYNGTAWGLDKSNEWTNEQTYSTGYYGQMIWLKNTDLDLSVNGNTGLSSTYQQIINWVDKNKTAYSIVQSWTNSSENVLVLRSYYRTDANTRRNSSIRNQCTATAKRWYPETDADTDLGSSNHRWKTFNDINPGALSLPDYDKFEPIDFSQWDVNLGWGNTYTPSEDGWLYGEIDDSATNSIYLYSAGLQPVQSVNRKYGISAQGNGSQSGYGGRLAVMIPVRKDIQYRFLIKASDVSDIFAVIFYPCLGNV